MRRLLKSEDFKTNNVNLPEFFTRKRKLPFRITILLILQKSVKSIQTVLNEFFDKLGKIAAPTASAFSKARNKLSYKAFIELNQKALVETVYEDENEYKKFMGFRLLAIDGSKVILPNEPEIREEFGAQQIANQRADVSGEYACSTVSVLYDVMNKIGVNSVMEHGKASEKDLVIKYHLPVLQQSDLLILDRGYPGYIFFAQLIKNETNFVARCSSNSFKVVQDLFHTQHDTDISIAAMLKPKRDIIGQVREAGLPEEILVRFVKIHKPNGKVHVLATSLLDQQLYPDSIFAGLYSLRWNIETFFDIIKNRLNLENFTGKTVESVKQDFFSTIFITGLESVLTRNAQEVLDQKIQNEQPQIINKAISFNAIKNKVIDLFYLEGDDDALLEQLTRMFLSKPISVQKNRQIPREQKKPPRRVLKFYKYHKKFCF